jgi:hypothetical protein
MTNNYNIDSTAAAPTSSGQIAVPKLWAETGREEVVTGLTRHIHLSLRKKEVRGFKRIVTILAAVCMATGLAWATQNPFIGEWKLDPSKTSMPDQMKVENNGGNKYTFDFGGGPETIVVDGSDQPGGYGGTMLSVKAEAADTWIVERKKDSRLLLKATWKLSKDGTTIKDYFRQFGSDGSTVFSMDYVYQRIGGGLGIAGDWQSIKETMNSPFPLEVKEFQGDGLSIITVLEKKTQDVKFDGKDYPNEGAGGGQRASSSAQRVDERTFVITEKVSGKITDTERVELSADLKTLTITKHVPGSEKPNVMVFERKQPDNR